MLDIKGHIIICASRLCSFLKNTLKNICFFLEQIRYISIGKNGKFYGFRVKNQVLSYDSVTIDLNNTCNLRCRFCFNTFDKAHFQMSLKEFESVLPVFDRVLPIGRYSPGILLSCLYEPTVANAFFEVLPRLPKSARKKVLFTTNLAAPISSEYIRILSRANVHHINLSIETLKEERYGQITGTRLYSSFMDNLSRLSGAMRSFSYHPRIYVITMALSMNMDELDDIFSFARKKFRCYHHDIRTPYIARYSNMNWCAEQLLPDEQADILKRRLSGNPFVHTDIRSVEEFRLFEENVKNTFYEPLDDEKLSEEESKRELDFCMQEEYLFLRFDADGTVTEKATGMKESLPEVESAADYYYEKLKRLYDRKINAFYCGDDWNGYEYSERIKMKVVLERRSLNEKALIIRGWYSYSNDMSKGDVCLVRTESGRYFRTYPIPENKLRTATTKKRYGFEVWVDRHALGISSECLCLCFADSKSRTVKCRIELPYLAYGRDYE